MRVLVSGATGFIGSKLVSYLRKNNYQSRLISRNSESEDTIKCNLQTDTLPQSAMLDVETVFHLAGFTHDSRDSYKIKNHYYNLNVLATVKLASLAAKSNVKKFVFLSSVKAGGNSNVDKCLNEDDQSFPEGIYGETKREAELKLLEISRDTNMQVIIIRPALVYGPNMKGNLKLMLNGIKKGWFPPLPEIGNRRSMIHVDDLVRAIIFTTEHNHSGGEIFIATDGVSYSSRDIYNSMCKASGKLIPKWSIPKIIFDLCSLISPSIKSKLDKLLGNAHYSAAKLETLGFKAKKRLEYINETDF